MLRFCNKFEAEPGGGAVRGFSVRAGDCGGSLLPGLMRERADKGTDALPVKTRTVFILPKKPAAFAAGGDGGIIILRGVFAQ